MINIFSVLWECGENAIFIRNNQKPSLAVIKVPVLLYSVHLLEINGAGCGHGVSGLRQNRNMSSSVVIWVVVHGSVVRGVLAGVVICNNKGNLKWTGMRRLSLESRS